MSRASSERMSLWRLVESVVDQWSSRLFLSALEPTPAPASAPRAAPWTDGARPLATRADRWMMPPPDDLAAVDQHAIPEHAMSEQARPEPAVAQPGQGVPEGPTATALPGLDLSALTRLDDDSVKLVAFSIVSVRRGHERFVKGGSEVVSGPMSQESFVSWVITKNIAAIRANEKRFLRVDFRVVRRWPREPLDYEENKLKTLDGIRRALDGEPSCDDERGAP